MSDFEFTAQPQSFVRAASFGQSDKIHGRTEQRRGYGEVKPWSVNVAECDYHVLTLNRQNEAYDKFAGNYTYIGRVQSQKDAYSRWTNYLLSIGVHAENAVMLSD